jgi:tetratricopeptide (TPR) repeat protein
MRRDDEAIASYREAIAVAERSVGHDSIVVANALNGIGSVYDDDKEDIERAAAPYREALALFRKLEGDKHPDTALALNNVSRVELLIGDEAAGVRDLEEALAIDEEVHGADHPSTASARMHLGVALYATGRDRTRGRALVTEAERVWRAARDPRADDAAAWLLTKR